MMSSSRVGKGLSLRLKALRAYHSTQQHIWDIGCDHGLLGLSFSDDFNIQSINLVDPSAPVIHTLHQTLKDSYITKSHINIHHQMGQSLLITSNSNCIFIAGMGGKEIGQIINALISQLDPTSRIVISPHRKILELRKLLNSLPIALIEEKVLWEDGQFYQMLCLSPSSTGKKVSLYGDALWQGETGVEYLNHQLRHFASHGDMASREYLEHLKGLTREYDI